MNETAAAGFSFTGIGAEAWFEFQAPSLPRDVLLAPSALSLRLNGSASDDASLLSFQKPTADGTASVVALGMATTDRRGAGRTRTAGTTVYQTLSITLLPEEVAGVYTALNVSFPATLPDNLSSGT
jgi:hypothetical protein